MLLTITNPFATPRRTLLRAACLLACAATLASAQQYTPPPPRLTTAPCVPTKKAPCDPPAVAAPAPVSDQFAFPGDAPASDKATPPTTVKTPAAAAQDFPFPGEPADTPSAPAGTDQKFPFPGEPADTPAGAKPKSSLPDDAGSSSSSSSSSSGDDDAPDSEKPALADKGSTGSTRAERRNRPAKPLTPEQRESEDLDVSHYYATTGNFKGSYLRAQDAVKTLPDEPLAHFALAEAARNLKQTTEAVAEYKLYLKLDPDGEKAKEARRALADAGSK